jgi:hypothetical protein
MSSSPARPRRSAVEIILWTAWRVLRVSFSAALVCHWLFPSFVELVQRLGLSDRWTYIAFTNVIHSALYFTVNFAYLFMERISIFAQFKIARKPSQQPSAEVFCPALSCVLSNFLIESPPVTYPLFAHFLTTLSLRTLS